MVLGRKLFKGVTGRAHRPRRTRVAREEIWAVCVGEGSAIREGGRQRWRHAPPLLPLLIPDDLQRNESRWFTLAGGEGEMSGARRAIHQSVRTCGRFHGVISRPSVPPCRTCGLMLEQVMAAQTLRDSPLVQIPWPHGVPREAHGLGRGALWQPFRGHRWSRRGRRHRWLHFGAWNWHYLWHGV